MATITANQLAVGLFNMAAGGYTAEANANLAANEAATANAYIALPQSGLNEFAFIGTASNAIFAKALVARLMSGADAALANDLAKAVVDYMSFPANATMGRGAVAVEMIKAVMAISPSNAALYAAAKPFQDKVALADASTSTSKDMAVLTVVVNGATPAPITTFYFTPTAGETLNGTAGNDIFEARIFDNGNSAQSNDKIFGGAGNDRMNLDIGNSQNFAITLQSTSVEQVAVRAQANAGDSANNNMSGKAVQIDAQRMEGVTQWESNNSRADVIIEDVRIANGAATKTVTIAMVETDPGNVDMGVYFNQLSLRNSSSGTAAINIFLMDTAAAAATPLTPLLNQNFDSYTFYANNQKVVLGGSTGAGAAAGTMINNATTYADLKTAFEAALKTASVNGVVTDLSASVAVKLSGLVNMTEEAGKAVTSKEVAANFVNLMGQIITLETASSQKISSQNDAGTEKGGWGNAPGVAPSTGAIVQTFNSGSSSSSELVTSKIILDDVGMGSTGGDLVVGGMSVGETSTSRGVERFEIEVRDNSKLQTINGTNNALREVTIVNGATSNVNGTSASSTTDSAYREVAQNAGDLTVNGNVNFTSTGTGTAANTGSDTILKGVNNANTINKGYAADHHGAFGFTDVRLIDASAMAGKLAFTAQITTDSIAKYVTAVDTAANPAGDVANAGNANFDVKGANFAYTGGSNNDTMVVTIDGAVAASNSNVVSGLSDFTFNIDGGAGNDAITVNLVSKTALVGGIENWAANQDLNNNITIKGGAGNDTIKTPGAGDINIDAGDGNDVVYTDNTGTMAKWVFNTTDQTNPVATNAARNVDDLRSDTNNSANFFKGTVTVTFKGISAAAVTLANATTFKASDLEINQAIKNSINNDATLNKLLIAEDGPGNTLVVTSKIDGTMTTADLKVAFTAAPATTVYTAAEISGMALAYNDVTLTTDALAHIAQALPKAVDYTTAFAQTAAGANITGMASISSSDNFITPGEGNDVIVLGTTKGIDAARSSNEVITFGAGFGNDVIVNFDNTIGSAGADHLNFSAFLSQGTAQTATKAAIPAAAVTVNNTTWANVDNLMSIVTKVKDVNDTDALVSELIKTADAAVSATPTTVTKQLYVVVDGTNIGTVYSVVNGAAVNDTVVVKQGSIDLADTPWLSMQPVSLQGVGAQSEGATTTTAIPAVVTPVFSVGGALTVAEGASATYTVTLSAAQTVATTVAYTLAGTGGAVLGTDTGVHAPAGNTGTLTFAAGATTATVVVPFATDAITPEAGEGVSLTLSAPSAGTALSATAATVTTAITDVVPPLGGPVAVAAAGSVSAAGADFTYNVASGNYTYSIANFAALDKIAFFSGAILAIVPDADDTDGLQSYTATDSGTAAVVTIALTGLTNAQDAGLFNVPSFNTVFGAGSMA